MYTGDTMGNELTTERTYGPKMAALTEFQRQFVDAMLDTGGINFTECARRAGSKATTPDSLRQIGAALAHHPGVLEGIREEAVKRLHSSAIMSVSILLEIAANTNHKPELRLKAATEIMNRTGMISVIGHQVTVDMPADTKAKLAKIAMLADKLGLDQDAKNKLLGQAGHVVDAEFTEVTPARVEEDWSVE